MAIDKELWKKARNLYEWGVTITEIEKETGITKSSLSKKSKIQQWKQGNLQQLKEEKVNHINGLINVEKKIKKEIQPHDLGDFNDSVEEAVDLKQYAEDTQKIIMEVMRKAAKVAGKFLEENEGGTFLRSESSKGKSYGLVTEIIQHLNPMLQEVTTVAMGGKPKTAIQINNDASGAGVKGDEPINGFQVNIIGE